VTKTHLLVGGRGEKKGREKGGEGRDDFCWLTERELYRLVAVAEKGSSHPVGTAIIREAKRRKIQFDHLIPSSFTDHSGLGIECTVEGRKIVIGNRMLAERKTTEKEVQKDSGLVRRLEAKGKLLCWAFRTCRRRRRL